MSFFRDVAHKKVEFRLRFTGDLRAPRDAFRFMRAVEQRSTIGRELPAPGRGRLSADPPLNDPAFLAPYSDIDEGKELPYESDEGYYGVAHLFR